MKIIVIKDTACNFPEQKASNRNAKIDTRVCLYTVQQESIEKDE